MNLNEIKALPSTYAVTFPNEWYEIDTTSLYLFGLLTLAEAGNVNAQLDLGMCLAYGDQLDKDMEEGLMWLTKVAEQGNITAKRLLAGFEANEDTMGIDVDINTRIHWLKVLAEQGDGEAQYDLSSYYTGFNGMFRPGTDMDKGLNWLVKSAAQQYDCAVSCLEEVCDGSFVIEKWQCAVPDGFDSHEEAAQHYLQAVINGDISAQQILVDLLKHAKFMVDERKNTPI